MIHKIALHMPHQLWFLRFGSIYKMMVHASKNPHPHPIFSKNYDVLFSALLFDLEMYVFKLPKFSMHTTEVISTSRGSCMIHMNIVYYICLWYTLTASRKPVNEFVRTCTEHLRQWTYVTETV